MSNDPMPTPKKPLRVEDFEAFYDSIYHQPPFEWQLDLMRQVASEGWPDYIDLPTASGKTVAIDIAVFHIALEQSHGSQAEEFRTAPRRIFFTVDRRLVVNQAFGRAQSLAKLLRAAVSGELLEGRNETQRQILETVAGWLLHAGGEGSPLPLDCFELRGGIFRDDAWVRTATQPTVVTTTVDQIGSRMLFRGYGVSDRNLPIHAALTANDALILLDEAHCSEPFAHTVDAVCRYRGSDWARHLVAAPLRLVQMTATPPELTGKKLFRLNTRHYEADRLLAKRHDASKPVRLVRDSGAKGKGLATKLAKTFVSQLEELIKAGAKRPAAICNRVAIARAVHAELLAKKIKADLLIGRMRPIDKEEVSVELDGLYRSDPNRPPAEDETRVLVATQTIEVGVDYDFDAMVTQCASLDALKQRFGRLDRLGNLPPPAEGAIRGIIIAAEGDLTELEKLKAEKPLDPIYGNALVHTWWHLLEHATTNTDDQPIVNFAVRLGGSINETKPPQECFAPRYQPPTLMPAHVDSLCQTSPRPMPEPNVAWYLHGVPPEGREANRPMIRVCWRSDLRLPPRLKDAVNRAAIVVAFTDASVKSDWIEAVDACPPSTAECLAVPMRVFQRWITGRTIRDDGGDVTAERPEVEVQKNEPLDRLPIRFGLVWRGGWQRGEANGRAKRTSRSVVLGPDNIYQGALFEEETVVLPAEFGGWSELGHVPGGPPDPAERRERIDQWIVARQRAELSDDSEFKEKFKIASIDRSANALSVRRGRNVFKLHPSVYLKPSEAWQRQFWNYIKAVGGLSPNRTAIDHRQMCTWAEAWIESLDDDERNDSFRENLDSFLSKRSLVRRYPGGIVWQSAILESAKTGLLPLPDSAFDDERDSRTGVGAVTLSSHSIDVRDRLRETLSVVDLPDAIREALLSAALWHDIGKSDPHFQAVLLGKTLLLASLYPVLLAKSDGQAGAFDAVLPKGFRHEDRSVELLRYAEPLADSSTDGVSELLRRYAVATHHGYSRPFTPVWKDVDPSTINLTSVGGPEIGSDEIARWVPRHCLDSGAGQDFWDAQRAFGAWGCAYLETLLRLGDWRASASPRESTADFLLGWSTGPTPPSSDQHQCILTGLDAGNPLAFLAAIGTFRMLTDRGLLLDWVHHHGGWRPRVTSREEISEELIIDWLLEALDDDAQTHPSLNARSLDEGLRRCFKRSAGLGRAERLIADWLSCESTDLPGGEPISQLQTSRRDYHAIGIRGVLNATAASQLRRTLFQPWDYADPVAGLSLHLEPREDRRHAYQWNTPSGDPTRKSSGGMIGANRLALEAWPVYQSFPLATVGGLKLQTIGFRGTRVADTQFRWPVWRGPIGLDVIGSLLADPELVAKTPDGQLLRDRGVEVIYRCYRILVERTPNLTSSEMVVAVSDSGQNVE